MILIQWIPGKFGSLKDFALRTYQKWSRDRVPQLGASLAFYTALSIAPLLVICLAVGALFFGDEAARGEVATQMDSLIGKQGSEAIQEIIVSADDPASGTASTLMGLAVLLFGASGVFAELQQSLNIIWEVQPPASRGIWGMIRSRFLSVVMVLGTAFLLLVSLVLSAVLASFGSVFNRMPESLAWMAGILNFSVSLVVITLLFAMIFRFLPNADIPWRQVWPGALLTALLFTIGKLLIGLYLGRSTLASGYGAAGSFVVLLVWIYYSAQILYLGAEITKICSEKEHEKSGSPEASAQEGKQPSPAATKTANAATA